MYIVRIAGKRQFGLLVATLLALVLCLSSCQQDAMIEPIPKAPVINPMDQPIVQETDDAPPKNGHGGESVKIPVDKSGDQLAAQTDDAPPKNGHGGE